MPTRPCRVEIRTQSLKDNYRFLAGLAADRAELLAIVKANAYGHSLEICAPAVCRAGARWLGVTSVEEGVAARKLCPEVRLLVIGGVFSGQGEELVRHRLTAVAWESWHLDELEQAAQAAGSESGSVPVHLEIDTGMSRQGVGPDGLAAVLERFGAGSPLRVEGVMTHLFAADEADGAVTEEQLARLEKLMLTVEAAGLRPDWLNVGNSAALLAGKAEAIAALAARHGMKAMLRPGLALYGLVPEYDPGFEPAEPEGVIAAAQAVAAGAELEVGGGGRAGRFRRARWWGITGPLWLRSRCGWRCMAAGYGDGLDRQARQPIQPAGARAARAAGGPHQHGPGGAGRDGDCRGRSGG